MHSERTSLINGTVPDERSEIKYTKTGNVFLIHRHVQNVRIGAPEALPACRVLGRDVVIEDVPHGGKSTDFPARTHLSLNSLPDTLHSGLVAHIAVHRRNMTSGSASYKSASSPTAS
jgi:hypothetical protein